MPYIPLEKRQEIEGSLIEDLTTGQLNYLITNFIRSWIVHKRPSYDRFNAAVGVLECVKQELYRRMIAPYEDKKCKENGDVY